jgi:hypothetical protein
MNLQSNCYRFNLRSWLNTIPFDRRNAVIKRIVNECGQGKYTIKRIMYMKPGDNTYVRPETKAAICAAFGKQLSELEAQPDSSEPMTDLNADEKHAA